MDIVERCLLEISLKLRQSKPQRVTSWYSIDISCNSDLVLSVQSSYCISAHFLKSAFQTVLLSEINHYFVCWNTFYFFNLFFFSFEFWDDLACRTLLTHWMAVPTITATNTIVPDSATSAMSTPCSCAMKPRTEKIAKPDTKLVPLFRHPSSKQSLCHTYVMEEIN